MGLRIRFLQSVLFGATLFPLAGLGAGVEEARRLKDEAVGIFQRGSTAELAPDQYAGCVLKLERAFDLVERSEARDEALLQEISAAIFWARKFATINQIEAIRKQQGEPVAPKRPEPEKPVKAPGPEEAGPPSPLLEAKQRYQRAEVFARGCQDDYSLALRWFQVAGETGGTDYSVKALEQARAAQERYQARLASSAAPQPQPPVSPVLQAADQVAAGGDLDQAIVLYEAAVAKEDGVEVQRRLAHAYFKKAKAIREALLPKLEQAEQEYAAAYQNALVEVRSMVGGSFKRLNPKDPALLAAQRRQAELAKEARESFKYYDRAMLAFQHVLERVPGGKDLEADGHRCLALSVRGDLTVRLRARGELLRFLDSYTPKNDLERTLYGFCRAEFERISPPASPGKR